MESTEREMIERALGTNFEVKKLYGEHLRFEARLDKLKKRPFLTPVEETEAKQLKQLKLRGVERMLKLAAPQSPT